MTKKDIRSLFREKRLALSPFFVESTSHLIIDLIFKNVNFENKVCSVFLPIQRLNEPITYPLINLIKNQGGKVAVSISDFNSRRMSHVIFESEQQLVLNSYDILEPTYGTPISNNELDIVFVPLLACDSSGFRVGYGKGFYDQLISELKPTAHTIGISMFDELVSIDDVEKHDKAIQSLATPKRFLNF